MIDYFEDYQFITQAHYVINTSAANDFVEKYSSEYICIALIIDSILSCTDQYHHHYYGHFLGLGSEDSLLDFGCGTGETTIAMAQVLIIIIAIVMTKTTIIIITLNRVYLGS